jgi:hypothetical protein
MGESPPVIQIITKINYVTRLVNGKRFDDKSFFQTVTAITLINTGHAQMYLTAQPITPSAYSAHRISGIDGLNPLYNRSATHGASLRDHQ